MGNIFNATLALAAASANNIAASQTPVAAGNLTLTAAAIAGTVPGAARRILFTPAGDEAANGTIWTVYGTNRTGSSITEAVAGTANPATATTLQDFLTVTRIAVNKAQADAVTVGTSGVASTSWFMLNNALTPVNVSIAVAVTGTINYTVEYTYDQIDMLPPGTLPTLYPLSALASKTANLDTLLAQPVYAIRLTQNSFTAPATATVLAIQAGLG